MSEATSTINEERVTPDMKMPNLSDLSIIQAGKKFSFLDAGLQLNGYEDFIVLLPVSAVAKNLKSIILTVVDPTDNKKFYSYLMRINNDRTAYVATVSAFGVLGRSQVRVEVFDYEAFTVGTYQAPIEFVDTNLSASSNERPSPLEVFFDRTNKILLTVLVLCFALLFLLLWRKKITEDKK